MSIVAVAALVKMFYASIVAGVGVAIVFSVAVLGAIRSSDLRREHRSRSAAAYSILMCVALLASAAIVVYGLIVVAHKT